MEERTLMTHIVKEPAVGFWNALFQPPMLIEPDACYVQVACFVFLRNVNKLAYMLC